MDKQAAITEIEAIFDQYRTSTPADQGLLNGLSDGKLYEVFVLANVIEQMQAAGFHLNFQGNSLKFKGAPGMIKTTDPHFEVRAFPSDDPLYWIFVDIEFDTLGHYQTAACDNSQRHEIDIVVVTTDNGYPGYYEIALGVECKTAANFEKYLLKEALGVRREMGVLTSQSFTTLLKGLGGVGFESVHFNPPSEFWVAFTDPKGTSYGASPAAYGITFWHLEP